LLDVFSEMHMIAVLDFLHAIVPILSGLAGVFWLAAASGRTVTPPWRRSTYVDLIHFPLHQAVWNERAAFSAALAAFGQLLLFIHDSTFWADLFALTAPVIPNTAPG
jgi:hypothetical protein